MNFFEKLEIDQVGFVSSEKTNIRKLPFNGFEGTGVGSFSSVREMDAGIIDICRQENNFFGGYSVRGTDDIMIKIFHGVIRD